MFNNGKFIGVIFFVIVFLVAACGFPQRDTRYDVEEKIERMRSTAIVIPFERMICWSTDSIVEISPWRKAKLKMVHYVDSATCSTCYLQKAATNEMLSHLEKVTNGVFYNVFIINPPNSKARKRIENDFNEKAIPSTIFVDSANVFTQMNPNIPKESIYHTFLLDENNKVILVGNSIFNNQIEDMLLAVIKDKTGINVSKSK